MQLSTARIARVLRGTRRSYFLTRARKISLVISNATPFSNINQYVAVKFILRKGRLNSPISADPTPLLNIGRYCLASPTQVIKGRNLSSGQKAHNFVGWEARQLGAFCRMISVDSRRQLSWFSILLVVCLGILGALSLDTISVVFGILLGLLITDTLLSDAIRALLGTLPRPPRMQNAITDVHGFQYGMDHSLLNIPRPTTLWLNMGYWEVGDAVET